MNPALAEATGAIDRLKISGQVSIIATRVTSRVPQSLLVGREIIEDIEELDSEEAERLRKDLYADDVNQFLKACEEDSSNILQIQPENVAMAARLHYYRIYFESSEKGAREVQEKKAMEWIYRALMRDPTNPDFQIKLADIFGMQERYDEAASILDRLERDDSSPQFVQQWLGYFLLFVPGREQDAIRHSLKFHEKFPDESSALYNAACGYAQLYAIELHAKRLESIPNSEKRVSSLSLLEEAIAIEPELALLARKRSQPSESFESMASDPDFMKLTASVQNKEKSDQ